MNPRAGPLALAIWALGCPADEDPGDAAGGLWQLPTPPGFPEPVVPEDNPATPAKFELGRHLFFDERLSGNGTLACGGCHLQALGFGDDLELPLGSTGETVPRNSMPLVNVAWNNTYAWANPTLLTLEEQHLNPMFGENPPELGMTGKEDEILARFAEDSTYTERFAAAFPGESEPYDIDHIVKALATYSRGLTSADSDYDRFIAGDATAMSAEARRGFALFNSETTECYHCHSGPNFTAAFVSVNEPTVASAFFNTGLYNIGGTGDYPPNNTGLYEFTGEPADMGRFRVATLRNLAATAPYFHDGSAATLADVIEHYNAGGRTIESGDHAGVGAENPYKHELIKPLALTDEQKADLLAFLDALNDDTFLTNPDIGDPGE